MSRTRLPPALRILDHTNLYTTAATAALVLYTRSLDVAFFAVAAVGCSLTVKVVKRIIRQPRPVVEQNGRRVKVTYGMPSTHSATITFFAVFGSGHGLHITYGRLTPECVGHPYPSVPESGLSHAFPAFAGVPTGHPTHSHSTASSSSLPRWTHTLSPPLLALHALVVCLSRVWLGHHTYPQVLAGAAYGTFYAFCIFSAWKCVALPGAPSLLALEQAVSSLLESSLVEGSRAVPVALAARPVQQRIFALVLNSVAVPLFGWAFS
ncbi:hypothetical protein CYLTODRAFT_408528 [Cylindrobasidium torrendii FP15055 ss-10]|uniref:Phosphatidic acid phosphatase type 2/haloperoxidase domain-containing protein n=1 Tax=Cylindrobasidium torrendii FP15055 ss-10 TaxID=1314674 RepID=A0A0D7BK41_9AGAR|nr:hypothetical protein CYLTODRAFT_408528 [Cylindrobasidium torrendii FP15055 ss-10]